MYRIKDFLYKSVFSKEGKKIGGVKDIYIDFFKGEIEGLLLSRLSIKNKENYVDKKAIIYIGEEIIVEAASKGEGLKLSEIIGMEVYLETGEIKGIVEDFVIDNVTLKLKGIIISAGFIDKLIHGREILLISKTILGEQSLLYVGEDNLILKNIPREGEKNGSYKKK